MGPTVAISYFCSSIFEFLCVFVVCVFVLAQCVFWLKHMLAQAFWLKPARINNVANIVDAGWIVVTYVSKPPRGRRWETDIGIKIGLRILTHPTQSL